MTMIEHLTKDSFKQKVFDYQNSRMYRFDGASGCDRFLHELVCSV